MQPIATEDLENVCQPVTRASGLPNRFYVDPDCFAAEKDRVFFASWSAVGFAKDVPAAGDVMPAVNPADGSDGFKYSAATSEEVDRAVMSARRAFTEVWRDASPSTRL